MSAERTCSECGRRFFSAKNRLCPLDQCSGTMCRVVIPQADKRLTGILSREPKSPLIEFYGLFPPRSYKWTPDEWRKCYGTLPRPGSTEAIILELPNTLPRH